MNSTLLHGLRLKIILNQNDPSDHGLDDRSTIMIEDWNSVSYTQKNSG